MKHLKDDRATVDFMIDFGIDIYILWKKNRVADAQLDVTGGPWVTHQCLANKIHIFFKSQNRTSTAYEKLKSMIDLI